MKFLILFFLLAPLYIFCQNVGIGTNSPDASAKLEVQSTSGGVLIPRLNNAERDAIPSPATGLMIYNGQVNRFEFYNGSAWSPIASASSSGPEISDNDGDTKISTEINPDEDTIRFIADGFELIKMDEKSLQIRNTQNSILIGKSAGRNNTGTRNTLLGISTGQNSNTGFDNTYVGFKAAMENTGHRNVIMGTRAGINSEGIDNVLIGVDAGSITTSDENVMIGTYAGSLNTMGYDNTFIGNQAGYSNKTGHNNTYLGKDAGHTSDSGDWNTSIGNFAGRQNLTGNDNTNIGVSSGYLNESGSLNVNVGARANINNNGSKNVVVGAYAGNNNTSGESNVYLGYQAGYNELGSNKLYIANTSTTQPLIYGEFDNKKVRIEESLEVINPTNNEVAIEGIASGNSGTAIKGEASNSSGTGYGGFFTSNSTVGRGVYGKSLNSGPFINYGGFFEAAGSQGRAVYGKATAYTGANNYGGYFESNGVSGTAVRGIAGAIGSVVNYGGHFTSFGGSGRGVFAEATATNGIGLYAKGAGLAAYLDGNTDVKGDLEIQAKSFDANLYMKTNSGITGKVLSKEDGTENILFGDLDGQNSEVLLHSNGAESMRIGTDGQVGIGTSNPISRLHLNSTSTESPLAIQINNSYKMYIPSSGRVGIGTTNPNSRLHINSDSGENPFRAQVAGITKFYLHSNGGAAIGTTSTPPVEGLRIDGLSGNGTKPLAVDNFGNLMVDEASYYVAINPMVFDARDNGALVVTETGLEAGIFTLALANVNLPHNAEIQSILIRVNDVNNMNVNVRLKEIDFPGNAINTLSTVQSAGSGGYGTFTKTLTTPHLVDNQNSNYYLEVSTSGGLITDEVILESVHIEYKY